MLLNTLCIVLKECTIDRHWSLTLAGKMFDELVKTYEVTKLFTSEMFLIIKIVSHFAAYFDAEELSLTKNILHFIFQSLLRMSFEKSQVSLGYL